ncbi:MAG: ArnT family glycosyltransferase [Acidimicrobiia bacterium]
MTVFVLSSLFIVAGGVLVSALLGQRRLHLWVLTVAVVWYLEIVVAGRLLSVAGQLGSRPAWFLADAVFLAATTLVWHRAGRPSPKPPVPRGILRDAIGGRFLAPALVVLGVVATALALVLLAASILIPQNLDDVLTAYLPRVGYWMQQGDLSPFPTSTYNSVQVSYPVNAQLPILRSIVLSGSDRYVGLEQWAASAIGAVGIFSLSRALGARRVAAIFCGGTWLLVPTVGAQSGLALTDLVSVSCLVTALAFGYVGWTEQRWSMLVLSSIAIGLGLGTKQTLIFVAPGLAAVLIGVLLVEWSRRRTWLLWAAVSAPVIALIGCVDYVRNWSYFGHPLGEPESFELFAVDATVQERLSAMSTNLRRTAADVFFADLTPSVAAHVRGLWRLKQYDRFIGTGRYLELGQAWTGFFPASMMLVGTTMAWYLVVRHRALGLLVPLVPAVTFIVFIFWTRTNFTGAFSRYMLIPAALFLCATAAAISHLNARSVGAKSIVGAAAFVVVVGMSVQSVHGALRIGTRPLVGDEQVWSASSTDLIGMVGGFDYPADITAALSYFDGCYGDTDRVGIMIPGKFPQSALFGHDYRRTVLQYVAPFPKVDRAFLDHERVPVVLVEAVVDPPVAIEGAGLDVTSFGSILIVTRTEVAHAGCS